MRSLLPLAIAGSVVVSSLPAIGEAASGAVSTASLVPHRAVYQISLARTRPGGMVAASGRTVIEFRDSCTGWTTVQRFVADMTNGQDDPNRTDFIATSWESKDGRHMRFSVHNSIDGKTQEKYQGSATLADDGGRVELDIPHGKSFPLPTGAILPTSQTMQVLRAAAKGQSSIHELVFQGGGKKDLYDANALIGRPSTSAEEATDRKADRDGLLTNLTARSVLISYYPYNSPGSSPDYEIAYRLYPDGVISSMSLIYSNFTLRAELTELKKLAPDCRSH